MSEVTTVAPARSRGDKYMHLLSLVLLGYAVADKGFAYIGVSPLYVGELSLFAGLFVAVTSRRAWRIMAGWTPALMLAFMIWGAANTIPYLGEYGIWALRDAVLWGYAMFAFVVGGLLLARPQRLRKLVVRYRKFVPVFLVALPIFWLPYVFAGGQSNIPSWPGTSVAIIDVKASDFLVHLAGVYAFVTLGLFAKRTPTWITAMIGVDVVITGFSSRGGLLAFLFSFFACMATRPFSRSTWRLVATGFVIVLTLGVTGASITFPGTDRELSLRQFASFAKSTTSSDKNNVGNVEGTKEWRLAWWATIASYTVTGPYFWTGKGFGVNLADDDGFQVDPDANSLRSPHSVHMTVLARTGVPGLLIWFALQASWFMRMLRAYRSASGENRRAWRALFATLVAFWGAALVNGSFDVYFEGPMGGIWFWTIFGIGMAATRIHRDQPEYFDLPAETAPVDVAGVVGTTPLAAR